MLQRARLLEMTAERERAKVLRAKAKQLPLRNGRDRYLEAIEAAQAGEYQRAIEGLESVLREEPLNPIAWWSKANVHIALLQPAEAEHCITVCIGLGPISTWPISSGECCDSMKNNSCPRRTTSRRYSVCVLIGPMRWSTGARVAGHGEA